MSAGILVGKKYYEPTAQGKEAEVKKRLEELERFRKL